MLHDKEVKQCLSSLEQIAKLGRSAWEELFALIDNSDEQGEISSFFTEYGENEGTYGG